LEVPNIVNQEQPESVLGVSYLRFGSKQEWVSLAPGDALSLYGPILYLKPANTAKCLFIIRDQRQPRAEACAAIQRSLLPIISPLTSKSERIKP